MIRSYFDAHCDTLWRTHAHGWSLEQNPGHLDLRRLSAYAPVGQVFALYEDSADRPREELWPYIQARAREFLAARDAHPELMQNCCLSVEGAELMDCDIEKIDIVKEWGVRWVNPTWNHANALAGPHTTDQGLTAAGRDFVRALWQRGVAVDVSHLSDRGFWDVLALGDGPVLASHSDCRALCGHSRNLTDDMARALFERGGFVGINFCVHFLGGDTLEAVLAHIDRFLELGGEDCLGMGSDFDGTDVPPEIGGVEGMGNLWAAMERRGYAETVTEKIAYGNLARFVGEIGDRRQEIF